MHILAHILGSDSIVFLECLEVELIGQKGMTLLKTLETWSPMAELSGFRAKKDGGLGSQMGRSHVPLPISFVFSLWPPYLTLLLPLSLTKS